MRVTSPIFRITCATMNVRFVRRIRVRVQRGGRFNVQDNFHALTIYKRDRITKDRRAKLNVLSIRIIRTKGVTCATNCRCGTLIFSNADVNTRLCTTMDVLHVNGREGGRCLRTLIHRSTTRFKRLCVMTCRRTCLDAIHVRDLSKLTSTRSPKLCLIKDSVCLFMRFVASIASTRRSCIM